MTYRSKHAVITLCLFLVLISPWLIGIYFKKSFNHFIELANRDLHWQINVLNYHQGWIGSTAEIEITFPQSFVDRYQLNLPPSAKILIKAVIAHGPIVYDQGISRLRFAQASLRGEILPTGSVQKYLLGESRSIAVIELTTIALLDGDWQSHIRIPFLSYRNNHFDIHVINGVAIKSDIDTKHDQIQSINLHMTIGNIIVNSLLASQWIKSIQIQPMNYKLSMNKEEALWTGKSTLQSKVATLVSSDNVVFTAYNLGVNSVWGFTADHIYNANISLIMDTIKSSSVSFPTSTNLSLRFSANDLNILNLVSYINYLTENLDSNLPQVDLTQVTSILTNTLSANSDLTGALDLNTALGPVNMQMQIRFMTNAMGEINVNEILENSRTDLSIKYTYPFIYRLASLYQQGIISKNDTIQHQLTRVYQLSMHQVTTPPDVSIDPDLKTLTPQQIINAMILAGYIVKQQDSYTTTFTLYQNHWYINYIPLPS